jgi:hypothetical protein
MLISIPLCSAQRVGNLECEAPVLLRSRHQQFDIALHKITTISEGKTLELRFESFNTLNHAQFYPKGSVDGTSTVRPSGTC